MSLLNRSPEHDALYDGEGRLQGGLASLEQLARVISIGSGDEQERENEDHRDEVEPALELPIHNPRGSSMLDSDDDMSDDPGSSDDDAMEEIVMDDMAHKDHPPESSESHSDSPTVVHSSPITISSTPPETATEGPIHQSPISESSVTSSPVSKSYSLRRSSKRTVTSDVILEVPVGERMKQVFLNQSVLSTLLVRPHIYSCSVLSLDSFAHRTYSSNFHGITFCTVWSMISSTRSSREELTVA